MPSRAALILLTLICPLLLIVLTVPGAATVWAAAPLICALPVLLIFVTAGGPRPAAAGLWVVWTILTGTWIALGWITRSSALAQPTAVQASLVMALMLLGLGLVPLILLGWLYARSFSDDGLHPEDLRALRKGPQA